MTCEVNVHCTRWISQNSVTCMALVSLSALMHFSARSFWKSSRSVFQCAGRGSLKECGIVGKKEKEGEKERVKERQHHHP